MVSYIVDTSQRQRFGLKMSPPLRSRLNNPIVSYIVDYVFFMGPLLRKLS